MTRNCTTNALFGPPFSPGGLAMSHLQRDQHLRVSTDSMFDLHVFSVSCVQQLSSSHTHRSCLCSPRTTSYLLRCFKLHHLRQQAQPLYLWHDHSLSLVVAPFVPSRPYLGFGAFMPFNLFGPNTSLPSESVHSPDTWSDPVAPTDQSPVPPPMPVRADSAQTLYAVLGLTPPTRPRRSWSRKMCKRRRMIKALQKNMRKSGR